MPKKEFRNSLVRVSTQGLFCPYLQTFVVPFPTRLTAPGSPRMADLATLKHYAVMFKYTPGNLRVFPVWSSVVFPSIYHQFIIKFHLGCGVVHYYIVHIFLRRPIILWTKRRPGSCTVHLVEMVMLSIALVHVPTSNSNFEHCDMVFGLIKSNLGISFNLHNFTFSLAAHGSEERSWTGSYHFDWDCSSVDFQILLSP